MRKPHLILAAGLYLAAAGFCGTATAQQAYDSHYDDDDRDAPPASPPPTGADAGYDYLRHEYYRYDGPAPQAPAAREQRGYRDGHVEREPRTSYYSGVRVDYAGGHRRCGCSYGYGYGYGGRHHRYADRYVGDDLDTQDYGRFSYNYSTRRYTDHHLGHGSWLDW